MEMRYWHVTVPLWPDLGLTGFVYLAMISITLSAPSGSGHREIERNLVIDTLWATAERGDRLEHLFAQVVPGRIDIVVFVMAENQQQAAHAAERIHRAAILRSPVLSGWCIAKVGGRERE